MEKPTQIFQKGTTFVLNVGFFFSQKMCHMSPSAVTFYFAAKFAFRTICFKKPRPKRH